jgi:hypothetical protein
VFAVSTQTYCLCLHNKNKSRCRECGGSAFCSHGKHKAYCKPCGGSALCKHDKYKTTCKECGGSAYCIHDKVKSYCRECGGSVFCSHGKRKKYCKLCGGSGLCKHNKDKTICRECGGSAFCIHDKYKSRCKECGGGSICSHGKRKDYCKPCGGSALCKSSFCDTTASRKYDKYCYFCYVHLFPDAEIAKNYRTKEKTITEQVLKSFSDVTWTNNKKVIDGCSLKRPDLLLDLGYQVIIIEIDENQHTSYDCSCENKRLMEISKDLNFRPLILIRFNPDGYTNEDGIKIKSPWKNLENGSIRIQKKYEDEWNDRVNILINTIKYWTENKSDKTIQGIELFFDTTLKTPIQKTIFL